MIRTFFHPRDVFGKWTVLEYAKGSHARVKCTCSCGTVQHVLAYNLKGQSNPGCKKCKNGRIPICPTLQKHPSYLRILKKISDIFKRCYNIKSDHFHRYGGRGIKVHPPWHTDKKSMIQYLASLSGWDDPSLQIDRIDNDGDYAPGNLRFVTRSANMLNRQGLVDGKRTEGTCERCENTFIRRKTHQRFCGVICRNRTNVDSMRTTNE